MSGQQVLLLFIELIALYLLVAFPLAMLAGKYLRRLDARHMPVPPAVRRIPAQRKAGDQS